MLSSDDSVSLWGGCREGIQEGHRYKRGMNSIIVRMIALALDSGFPNLEDAGLQAALRGDQPLIEVPGSPRDSTLSGAQKTSPILGTRIVSANCPC